MLFTSFQVAKRREKLLNYTCCSLESLTLPNTFINFAVLDRACFGDANIAGQERDAKQSTSRHCSLHQLIACTPPQHPPSLYILKLSAWWWLHDFGPNGTCRLPRTWRGSQPVSTCWKTFVLILWKGCTISWSPHAESCKRNGHRSRLLSILVFNWFTDYCIFAQC